MANIENWLTVVEAAAHFGYSNPDALTRRLRQLRQQQKVTDTGDIPARYAPGDKKTPDKIVLLWVGKKSFLIRADAPKSLLNSKKGKRAKSESG
ncbi:MAG: hypothetical protein KC415_05595 [Anaerolineales bacterium]|nr:hypothetical protein [Anaerolineales bacterium]